MADECCGYKIGFGSKAADGLELRFTQAEFDAIELTPDELHVFRSAKKDELPFINVDGLYFQPKRNLYSDVRFLPKYVR